MRAAHLLAGLVGLISTQAYFILTHETLETTRLDPIISPGPQNPSQHVHTIVGGSNFDSLMTYSSTQQSQCTTAPVSVDKSNYWTPQLYYYNYTFQTYEAIPVAFVNTYYLNRYGSNGQLQAFPDGLRMVSGSPNRRTNDGTPDSLAITFVCLDYDGDHSNDPDWAERNNFFDHNCPSGMRAQVFFRSCWDGVNLDSSDHVSHMAWPSGGVDGGDCPASHPVRLVSLFYEFIYAVQNFPFNPAGTPTWVFANGDTTGYGMHGDFLNGWPAYNNGTNVLQQALEQCNDNNGVGGELNNCPPFVPYLDSASAQACLPQNLMVNEDVGFDRPLARLPGNNPIWIGNSTTKPSWPGYVESSTFTNFKSVIPQGYEYVGCIAEGTSGRALQGASVSSANMTQAVCVSYCESLGFPLAGMEYSTQCYCGDAMVGGASNTTLLEWDQCGLRCANNSYEMCGGYSTLTLYNNPSMYESTSLPSGWSYVGCNTEGSGQRALTGYSYAASNMTQEVCISVCAARGFTFAGVEYADECYCGNALSSGSVAASEGDCNMNCAGDAHSQCGGPNRLSLFEFAKPAASLWTSMGCYTEGTNSRALTGYFNQSSGMTIEACLSQCYQQGFTYCGVEYSSQCFGGTILATGSNLVDGSQCAMTCSGNSAEICGGPNRLNVWELTNPPKATLPSGWTDNGCWTEVQNGRTLNGYGFSSSSMTAALCIETCASKNYTMAGTEYSSECYCGDAFVGNTTSAPSSDCSMSCSGDKSALCGGPMRLNTYLSSS